MNQDFWNKVYTEKSETEVSWFQEIPTVSLNLINQLNLPKSAQIIDVGGGTSLLVDSLLKDNFSNLTLLDISEIALKKVQKRLEQNKCKVQYIVSDVLDFRPHFQFDLWHDRAAFHFLTDEAHIQKYIQTAELSIRSGGYLIISSFSKSGPEKCSGLKIHQYSKEELQSTFKSNFTIQTYQESDHQTPWGSIQHFIFCVFKKN